MIENTHPGLEAAGSSGKNGGRPKKLDEKKIAMAKELRKDPVRTVKEICELLKISRATFYNYTYKQSAGA